MSDPDTMLSVMAEAATPLARANRSVNSLALKESMVSAIWKVTTRDGSVAGVTRGEGGDGGEGGGEDGGGEDGGGEGGGGGGSEGGTAWQVETVLVVQVETVQRETPVRIVAQEQTVAPQQLSTQMLGPCAGSARSQWSLQC